MGSQSTGNPSGRSMSMGVGPRHIPRRGRGWGGRQAEMWFCARRRDLRAIEKILDFIFQKKTKDKTCTEGILLYILVAYKP
jgi:hypothetical protein